MLWAIRPLRCCDEPTYLILLKSKFETMPCKKDTLRNPKP